MTDINMCREAKKILTEAVEQGELPFLSFGIGQGSTEDEFSVAVLNNFESQFPPTYHDSLISTLGSHGLLEGVEITYRFTDAEAQ